MTIPSESTNTDDSVTTRTGSALSTESLSQDNICDLDGSRLEVHGRTTIGTVDYEVRKCSSNPAHMKMMPI